MFLRFLNRLFPSSPPPAEPQPEEITATMTVKDLKEYKSRLAGSQARDLAEFEKNFLLVSGGVLAFSITFIKDIVKIETAALLPLLTLSWTCIGLSIGLMLFSFMRSAEASDKIRYAIDDFQHQHNFYVDTQALTVEQTVALRKQADALFRQSKEGLKGMRYWAVRSFLAGLGIFFCFISVNLFRENNGKKTNTPVVLKLDPATRELSIEGQTLILKDSTLYLKR